MAPGEATKLEDEAQEQLEQEALDLSAVEVNDIRNKKAGALGSSGALTRYRQNLKRNL